MQKKKRITLFGASGYTGSLIAQKLVSFDQKFTLAGRNASKLSALRDKLRADLRVMVVDINNASQVLNMLEDTEILINCVGPYNLLGQQVLSKVRNKPVAYIDISGEMGYIKNSFEMNHERAIRSGSTIVHSLAFESCLADFLAHRIAEKEQEYQEISSYYFFNRTIPSPGTRLTMEISHLYPSYIYEDSKLVNANIFSRNKNVEFSELPGLNKALFTPYPEVLFFARNFKVKNAGSYLLMRESDAKIAEATLEHSQQKSLEEILQRNLKRIKKFPDKGQRSLQKFTLCIKKVPIEGTSQSIILKGADMYGITANLVVKAVEYLLHMSDIQPGVFTPAEFIDNPAFFYDIISICKLELKEDAKMIEYEAE